MQSKLRKLKIDYEKVSAGMIEIIDDLCLKDDNYAGALMLGMLPAPIMDLLKKLFKEKLYSLFLQQQGFSVEEGNKMFKDKLGIEEQYKIPNDVISEFMQIVSCKIMRHYKKEGVIVL